jgi:hypothetical protein
LEGPVSFSFNILDQNDRPVFFDDTVRPFMPDFMAGRVNVQVARLNPQEKTIIGTEIVSSGTKLSPCRIISPIFSAHFPGTYCSPHWRYWFRGIPLKITGLPSFLLSHSGGTDGLSHLTPAFKTLHFTTLLVLGSTHSAASGSYTVITHNTSKA